MNLGKKNAEESVNYLIKLTHDLGIYHPFGAYVLTSQKFLEWSASSHPDSHHYGKYGLVIHTAEVVKLALESNKITGLNVPEDKIVLAGIFHDCAKIYDYEPLDETLEDWRKTEHSYNIHHVAGSAFEWKSVCGGRILPKEYVDEITHAILSHHRMPEWGSPISPKTPLAWCVHSADYTSAKLYNKAKYEGSI